MARPDVTMALAIKVNPADIASLEGLARDAQALADRLRAMAAPDGDAADTVLRTPDQWCTEHGIRVLDPDGWRHGDALPWDTPISLDEFFRRLAKSTVMPTDQAADIRQLATVKHAPHELCDCRPGEKYHCAASAPTES